MLGIIGSEDRMQGAVVADAVNLAARVESLTRIYGSWITTSEVTVSRLIEPEKFELRFVDKVLVKGRKTPVSVYEVLDGSPESEIRSKGETRGTFEAGLELYYGKKFSEASVQFNQVLQMDPEDRASRIYLKRCANYMVKGVPEHWTGVEDLRKK
jgi:two-component system sensor histidine kinase ChiS